MFIEDRMFVYCYEDSSTDHQASRNGNGHAYSARRSRQFPCYTKHLSISLHSALRIMQLLNIQFSSLRGSVLALFLAASLVLTGCDSGGSGTDDPDPEPTTTLLDIVNDTESLSTLGAALEATGQAGALGDEDAQFTVFAPSNAAFENVDVQSLVDNPNLTSDLLNFHIVQGEALTASDLESRPNVITLEGQTLPVETVNGTLTVGGIPVTQADVEADNGVAHVIEGVLVPDSFPRKLTFDLAAQTNGGAVPDGVDGTVTFWEAGADQTVITLALDNGATETTVSHPAHIHENSASETGPIAIYLSPLDGTASPANNGTSARLVDRSFDELAAFDGYVNIHESVANLGNVVSQGNIGSNATGTLGAGLDLIENPQTITYELAANANTGAIAPAGIPGEFQLLELTETLTLATVRLDVDGDGMYEDGETGAGVSHPAHIHQNSASETGPIEFFLSPIDGTDPAAKGSQILAATFDELTGFDGYVNVHESAANLAEVVSQGNIGSNAGTGGGSTADVTITINNIGASAWEVTGVDGANIDDISDGGENPALTLSVGTRYRFVNNGDAAHPLGFQNGASEYVLNQDGSGSFEDESEVNYAEDADGVTFTYTQALADAVTTYRCTIHASMEGTVQAN